MARLLSLRFRSGCGWLSCGAALLAGLALPLHAQTMMNSGTTPESAPTPAAPTPATPPTKPVTTAATTNAPPAIPPVPPDVMGKYGKILSPSDDIGYPLKLKMPGPGIGEVKVPKMDELDMRDKLEQLATLSDDEIRTQLAQWPAYSKMNLRDQGGMLQRIQDFRDYRTRVAMQKAHDMGLLTLTDADKARFEKEYWVKRLQMDRDIAKQIGPIIAQHEQKLNNDLFREFSQASPGPLAHAPVANKSATTTASTSAVASSPAPAANSMQTGPPLGQTAPAHN